MREGAISTIAQPAPARPDADLAAARAARQVGNSAKAAEICSRIIRKRPRSADALHLLGVIAGEAGRTERALQLLAKAAAAAPGRADIVCDLGNALKAAGRLDEAIARHREVVALAPGSPEALSNLGTTLVKAGRAEEALEVLRRSVALRAGDAELRFNLGNALLAAERFNEAAEALGQAVELCPAHARAHANRGVALKETGDIEAAIASFRRALAIDPRHTGAGWNLALALLMAGRYDAGWAGYEVRRALPDFPIRRLPGRAWDGSRSAEGPVLVHAEQGLGDTIQFARYLPLAAARVNGLTFACPAGLEPLFAQSFPELAITTLDRPLPFHAAEAPLMSLPLRLGRPEPFFPATGPYIRPSPERRRRWRAALPADGINVGIAWQGQPDYRADRRRSIALHQLGPLAALPGINLVSLQARPGAEQRDLVPWGPRIVDPGPGFDAEGAFLDSAALIADLDLVVTSDTAIAHLAGALGAETWLALAYVPDWRWGLTGETTSWYPTMRLFRQPAPGDWPAVFSRIAETLARRLTRPHAARLAAG